MPLVESISRADLLLAVGTATVGATSVPMSGFAWTDRFGSALPWQWQSNGFAAPTNGVTGIIQPAQSWRATVTGGTGTVYINHGVASATSYFAAMTQFNSAALQEGRSLLSLLQFYSSVAGATVQVEIYG